MYVSNYRVLRLIFLAFQLHHRNYKALVGWADARPMQRNFQQNLIRAVINYSN